MRDKIFWETSTDQYNGKVSKSMTLLSASSYVLKCKRDYVHCEFIPISRDWLYTSHGRASRSSRFACKIFLMTGLVRLAFFYRKINASSIPLLYTLKMNGLGDEIYVTDESRITRFLMQCLEWEESHVSREKYTIGNHVENG